MNDEKMTLEKFVELTKSDKWMTVEEYVAALNDAGYWPDDFESQALEIAKKDHVRRMVRSIKDSTGWVSHASVVTKREDGEEVRVYKQESLFNLDDYKQVVDYHRERGLHHIHMANGYVVRANERFGAQLELPFPGTRETD